MTRDIIQISNDAEFVILLFNEIKVRKGQYFCGTHIIIEEENKNPILNQLLWKKIGDF